MRTASIVLIVVALLAAPLSTRGEAQMPTTRIDIARLELGALPGEFTTGLTGQGEPGHWSVVKDESSGPGRAIAQTSPDRTDYRFPLAIYQKTDAKDVAVSIRFKPVGGRVDQAGGIAIRLSSPDNYYVVRANALEDNVRFYRVVKGRREQLAGVNTKVASGQWHTLAIRAEGNRFTISFNDKQLFTATDDTFAGAGKIALWTKADSITHFDQLAIQPL
jgi:hypothetical protein